MTTAELANFINMNIPTFIGIELLETGKAYHYTPNSDAIFESGRFLGAPINNQLDKTQTQLYSPPAVSDPGVVFAYEQFEATNTEGFNCKIIEVRYATAIRAKHSQEAELGAPPTVIMLNTEITGFKLADT